MRQTSEQNQMQKATSSTPLIPYFDYSLDFLHIQKDSLQQLSTELQAIDKIYLPELENDIDSYLNRVQSKVIQNLNYLDEKRRQDAKSVESELKGQELELGVTRNINNLIHTNNQKTINFLNIQSSMMNTSSIQEFQQNQNYNIDGPLSAQDTKRIRQNQQYFERIEKIVNFNKSGIQEMNQYIDVLEKLYALKVTSPCQDTNVFTFTKINPLKEEEPHSLNLTFIGDQVFAKTEPQIRQLMIFVQEFQISRDLLILVQRVRKSFVDIYRFKNTDNNTARFESLKK